MALALVLTVGMVVGLAYWLTPQLLMRWDSWLEIQRARYVRPPNPEKAPIPADLQSLALTYPEDWAREDALKRLRELYEETGNWDDVRALATQLRMGE